MSAPTPYVVDRTGWPSGEWDDEPDRVDFTTAAGLPGIILRHGSMGHLCGYVAVTKDHPAYGKSDAGIYEKDSDGDDDYARPIHNPVNGISVHGGITYSNKCSGDVCHVPAPGEPDDVWWLGFDFSHSRDLSPARAKYGSAANYATYRPIDYVRAECESVAGQLVAMMVARPAGEEMACV